MSITRLRALYDRVYGLDPAARAALLDAEGIEPTLRAELEALLEPVAPTADPIAALVDRTARDAVIGTGSERIGPYRVLGMLGEGGMGTVLLAERADGEFEKKVAIKLIRGHVTTQARERFRRERQLLAQLDHPNIAALIDGGSTPGGEPYLVMDYIEGETLPDWIARAQPRLEARLALFVAVCRAVAHAHQHLVVHRDLKPSNILVRRDGSPVLLDFGIARLLQTDRGDAATGSRLMTPAWASPEQLLGRPVTTATDVYGLGLVLYALVAGRVPDRGDAARAASVELPPPSKSAESAALPALRAEARRLRGDLDKIVRRAVRTEPEARYPSALALAADVEAWLAGRPVQAAGTHVTYLLSRFIRRHRVATAAVTAALAASIAFAVGLARERDRARQAESRAVREAAVANETTRFLVELFSELDPELHPGRGLSGRDLLDLGRERLEHLSTDSASVRARLQRSLGWIYSNVGDPARAIELLEAVQQESAGDPTLVEQVQAETALARSYYQLTRLEPSLASAQRATQLAEQATPRDERMLAHALMARGVSEQALARYSDAEASFARAQALFESSGAEVELASVLHNRAWLAEQRGDDVTALALYEQAYAHKVAVLGPDHPKALTSLHGRSKSLTALGRHDEGIVLLEELLERSIRVHGAGTHSVQGALSELGSALQDAGRYAEAQRYYEQALDASRALERDSGMLEATVLNNLGTLLEDRGDVTAAESHYRRSRDLRRQHLPEGHPSRAVPAHNLARMLISVGRLDEATPFADEARALRAAALPDAHPLRLSTEVVQAQLALSRGDEAEAGVILASIDSALATGATLPPTSRAALHETRARIAQRHARHDERIAAMDQALIAAAEMFASTHPRHAQYQLGLAEARLDAGDRAGAAALYDRISPVLRAHLVAQAPALTQLDALERGLRLRTR